MINSIVKASNNSLSEVAAMILIEVSTKPGISIVEICEKIEKDYEPYFVKYNTGILQKRSLIVKVDGYKLTYFGQELLERAKSNFYGENNV